MRSKKYKGFGPPPSPEQVDRGFAKLFAQHELEIEQLRESLADPASRGQIDAIFGQPCASDEPCYKNAYLSGKLAIVQAPPATIQIIDELKPIVTELLQEVKGGTDGATV